MAQSRDHLRDDVRARQLLAAERLAHPLVLGRWLAAHMLISREQEAARPHRWVMHRVAGVRINHLGDHLDQRPLREILAGAGLYLTRVPLEQAFVDGPLHVDVEAHPGLGSDQRHQPLQLGRVTDLVLGL